MIKATNLALALIALVAAHGFCQPRGAKFGYPPEMPGARSEIYKTVGDVKLNMYIFEPAGHKPSDRTPAIVFFFGGGWTAGSPAQFYQHCRHLAERGMVAMTADYRVSTRHKVKALQCVQDAKSAVRWIRANAKRLGVDPDHIAAGGGSAGGHLAAAIGTIAGLDEPAEDSSISSVPNALVLFNPAVVLSMEGLPQLGDPKRIEGLAARMGIEPIKLSPYHHVKKGVPPTIIFHGTADTAVPFKTVELFAEAMTKAVNQCKLVPYEGRTHGFFNFGRGNGSDYQSTLRMMDAFLVEEGFLKPPSK